MMPTLKLKIKEYPKRSTIMCSQIFVGFRQRYFTQGLRIITQFFWDALWIFNNFK